MSKARFVGTAVVLEGRKPIQVAAAFGRLQHIGVGRTHVILLIQDLNVRVVNAVTGELLRDLEIDPNRDYQGRNQDHKKNSRTCISQVQEIPMS